MIILITGVPGAGKTLYAVSEFLTKQFKDRPLYVYNIPDLLVHHELLSEQDVNNWYDGRVPENSVIVIDELQDIWRPRSSTAPVPPYISKLETHRHQGIDFLLLTQHPQLIDINVRRLVGRHIHVRRAWGAPAATVYEWDSISMNINATRNAQMKLWRYPRKAYKLYKSSKLHTSTGQKFPFVLKIAALILLSLPVIWYFAGKHLITKYKDDLNDKSQIAQNQKQNSAVKKIDLSNTSASGKEKVLTKEEYAAQFVPRQQNVRHSAPRYDDLTKPVRVPVVGGCLAMAAKCTCYAQDGSPYNVHPDQCRVLVTQTLFYDFDPEPNKRAQNQQQRSVAGVAAPVFNPPGGG